jgi:glyoxylase-like metal-dependent hydrolase (beta-lactamase superfamily II)
MKKRHIILTILLALFTLQANAFETIKVAQDVYALVGDLGQRSTLNLGHNMTSGFIITQDGILVVDSGGSYSGAQAIHQAIKKISDKPIKWVVNTGGQDHRWLGNSYFSTLKDITLMTSDACKTDMIKRTSFQMSMAEKYIKDKFEKTQAVYPSFTFASKYTLPIKDKKIELIYTGGGHTPGDIFVSLPEHGIVFTGDIVFSQRLLGVQQDGALRWIKSLEYLRDVIKPMVVIPGHGAVTNLKTSLKDSYDYLVLLRDKVKLGFEQGAFDPVEAIEGIDQSVFSYLENYSSISFRSRNALRVAEQISKTLEQ